MIHNMQFNFFIIFTLIFFYLFLRILVNIKYNNQAIIKELCLTGLIVSLLYIIAFKILPMPNLIKYPTDTIFIPFKVISNLLSGGDLRNTILFILGNIVLFMPIGFFAFFCFEGSMKDTLLTCLIISISVELIQLLLPLKMTSVDEVFLNVLGGFIGILFSYNYVKKLI